MNNQDAASTKKTAKKKKCTMWEICPWADDFFFPQAWELNKAWKEKEKKKEKKKIPTTHNITFQDRYVCLHMHSAHKTPAEANVILLPWFP